MSDIEHEKLGVPPAGTILAGKYVVERVLGAGAMGVVVAARHHFLGQTVAIKLMTASRERHATAVARFTREARAIAMLASEHVVRILDFGLLDGGRPFMVMQFLAGHDLAAEVRARGGKLPQVEAVDHVIQACAGLAVAHAAGIVHRDIKPGNLLLTSRANGEPLVVLVDFGISKTIKETDTELSLTVSQTTLGSPLYMSPEQIRDPKTVDARTDIWSLGVLLQFLLSGKPAFTAGEASGVLAAVIADEPASLQREAPEVAAGLVEVVLRCLEKKPAFRFGSAKELAQALAPYASKAGAAIAQKIAHETVSAMRSSVVPPSPLIIEAGTFESMTRAQRGTATRGTMLRSGIALAFVLATLGIGAAISVRGSRRLPQEPAAASNEVVAHDVLAPASSAAALVAPPTLSTEGGDAGSDAGLITREATAAVPSAPRVAPSGPARENSGHRAASAPAVATPRVAMPRTKSPPDPLDTPK